MDRYLLNSTVSWGAIIAGGFVAAAVTLIVAAFGVGAGLAVVSPWSGEGISATTASWAAGLFLVVIAMLASTIGGYITGRLRHGWEDVHEDERFFRDTAHGFVTWAFATVMTASVLAAAGTHIIARALSPPQQPEQARLLLVQAMFTSIDYWFFVSSRWSLRPLLRSRLVAFSMSFGSDWMTWMISSCTAFRLCPLANARSNASKRSVRRARRSRRLWVFDFQPRS